MLHQSLALSDLLLEEEAPRSIYCSRKTLTVLMLVGSVFALLLRWTHGQHVRVQTSTINMVSNAERSAAEKSTEKRIDPEDGNSYTFKELEQRYKEITPEDGEPYTPEELQEYWDKDCKRVPIPTTPKPDFLHSKQTDAAARLDDYEYQFEKLRKADLENKKKVKKKISMEKRIFDWQEARAQKRQAEKDARPIRPEQTRELFPVEKELGFNMFLTSNRPIKDFYESVGWSALPPGYRDMHPELGPMHKAEKDPEYQKKLQQVWDNEMPESYKRKVAKEAAEREDTGKESGGVQGLLSKLLGSEDR